MAGRAILPPTYPLNTPPSPLSSNLAIWTPSRPALPQPYPHRPSPMLTSLSPSWLLLKPTARRSFESNWPDVSRLCFHLVFNPSMLRFNAKFVMLSARVVNEDANISIIQETQDHFFSTVENYKQREAEAKLFRSRYGDTTAAAVATSATDGIALLTGKFSWIYSL